MDLNVNIGGKKLSNPVGVASGTFGYGSEYEKLLNFESIGAIFTKAITLEPRSGNSVPRIVETPSGLLNSIGLANVGVESFVKSKLPFLMELPCSIIPNIAGSTEEEYKKVIVYLEEQANVFGYEINISCPNVKHGALAFGTDPKNVESLTRKLRKLTSRPLIIKLTPNVTDITSIAKAAEYGGADAISLINTLVGMVIDVKTLLPVLAAKTGGLSGPAVRPVGVAMTYKVSRAVKIPVIGMGGITEPDDALQYFLAGADAIQIGTANFIDPSLCQRVLEKICEFCAMNRLSSVSQIKQLLKES